MATQPENEGIPFDDLIEQIWKVHPGKKDWLKAETEKRAEEHSKLNSIYDELCWFLAEADLTLRNLYALKILKKLSNESMAMPSEPNIRFLAEKISEYHNSLPELEWQLAERKALIDLLGEK